MRALLCVSVLWSLTAFGSESTTTELHNKYLGSDVQTATYVTQGNPLPSNANGGSFTLSVKVNDRSESVYVKVNALDTDGDVDAGGRFVLNDANGVAIGRGKCSAQKFSGGGESKVYLLRLVDYLYLMDYLTVCDMQFTTSGVGGGVVQLRLVFRGEGALTREGNAGKLLLIDGSISKSNVDGYKRLDWEVLTALGENSLGDCMTDVGVNDCHGANF